MDQPASESLSFPTSVEATLAFWPSVALSFISTSQYLVLGSRVELDGAEKSFFPFVAKLLDGLVSVYFSVPGLLDELVYMAATKFATSALAGNEENHMEAVLSVYPFEFEPVVNRCASSR